MTSEGHVGGHYELRAIAHDEAGLTTIGDKRKDGTSASFDVPLRVPLRLVVGFSRVKHERKGHKVVRTRVLVPSRKVRFGRKVVVSGKLTHEAADQPLNNATLEVYARPPCS